ncbi:MAG: hypothetical protein AMS17_08320 [Spirochaetes bacterium DG_61]|jgi:flagellar biosynthesis/type III secretory pathway chaperone|nr:MAG: hypothetical protein AMS17_08320 [Spirochaetes bacterium DG_61]
MQQTMNELMTALDRLVGLHTELLEVEQKKLSAIIDQDWVGLEQLLLKSRETLSEIGCVETQRMGIVERICEREDATLSDVEKKASGRVGRELRNYGERLANLIAQQKSMNERMENLLKSSLEIVNFSLALLSGSEAEGKTYAKDGQESGNEEKCTPLVFDIKA